MVARFTKIVLLFQACAVAALAFVFYRWTNVGNAAAALLLAGGALVLVRLLIVANNFFLAWIYRSETPPQYKVGAMQAVRMFIEEFAASMRMWFWYMPFGVLRDHCFADSKAPPVLLIPGYGSNRGYWIPFSRRLQRERISHRAIDLEPMFGDIDDFVPAVRAAIDDYCRDTGHEKIIVVAHSMGGLAARAYLCKHGARQVAKVVTVGTPHHGTHLARFGKGINSSQMRRTGDAADGEPSTWLRKLAAEETCIAESNFVSIYTHHDNIIAPQSSCHLSGARNIALSGVGHVALCTNAKVQDKIIAEILHSEKQTEDLQLKPA
jgi:triacylglycerol esterase/lipase EstA (alpha/beta hydrolase family)